MTAWRSAGPNELTMSSVVGVVDGETAGNAGDFDGLCGTVPNGVCAGNLGVGNCAARLATKMKMANVACKNRDITIISRC